MSKKEIKTCIENIETITKEHPLLVVGCAVIGGALIGASVTLLLKEE